MSLPLGTSAKVEQLLLLQLLRQSQGQESHHCIHEITESTVCSRPWDFASVGLALSQLSHEVLQHIRTARHAENLICIHDGHCLHQQAPGTAAWQGHIFWALSMLKQHCHCFAIMPTTLRQRSRTSSSCKLQA